MSEGIGVNKTDKSKECMFCHYWYFLKKNFSYGPYTCDGCYDIVQRSTDFKNIAIVHIKKTAYIFIVMIKIIIIIIIMKMRMRITIIIEIFFSE